jgi:hypothetical protein
MRLGPSQKVDALYSFLSKFVQIQRIAA